MDILKCLAGEYVSEAVAACVTCPANYYNTAPGWNVKCEPCTSCNRYSHVLYECNKTHDNICDCDVGYTRSSSRPKFCVKIKKFVLEGVRKFTESNFVTSNFSSVDKGVRKFTESNFVTSNFSSVEKALDNATTNISATTDHSYHWTPWLPGWSCSSLVASVITTLSVCLLITGIYICCKMMSRAKRQQHDAAMIADPEKNPVVEHQPQVIQEEKQGLLWEQENQNSISVDTRGSLSQFNSGGSDQSGIAESSPDMDCPTAVRPAACGEAGWTSGRNNEPLPPSSLCQEQESRYSSLDLRADDDLTPF